MGKAFIQHENEEQVCHNITPQLGTAQLCTDFSQGIFGTRKALETSAGITPLHWAPIARPGCPDQPGTALKGQG